MPGQRLKIVGKGGAEYFLLDASEVFAFSAEGDIVWIATARKRYQATQTLKVLEERLRDTGFQRIHRNALVNVDHVRASKRQARGIRRLVNW